MQSVWNLQSRTNLSSTLTFMCEHFDECVKKQDTSTLYIHSTPAALNQKEIINPMLTAKWKESVHETIKVL